MTTQQKIEAVKKSMPNASEVEIKETIKQVNWLQKWDTTLKILRNKYQQDTGEQIEQMEFNMFIYQTQRNLPSQFSKQQAILN